MLPEEIGQNVKKNNQMLEEIEKYLKKDDNTKSENQLSDLHTVQEDEYDDEDDEMNPAAFIHNMKEYEDHLMQVIQHDLILGECMNHVAKISKVKTFLLMQILKKRFQRKQNGSILI